MRWSEVLPWIVLALSLALPFPALAGNVEPVNLQEKLHDLLPRNVRWALAVVDLKDGREMIGIGTAREEPLAPGSLVKLITAGAVLEMGGIDLGTGNAGHSPYFILKGGQLVAFAVSEAGCARVGQAGKVGGRQA